MRDSTFWAFAILLIHIGLGDRQLHFRDHDESFTIVIFADLHVGANPGATEATQSAQRIVLASEHPDLVIFLGDMVHGAHYPGPLRAHERDRDGGWYKARYKEAVEEVVRAGVPWAMILGNHDTEGGVTQEKATAIDAEYKGSLTKQGPRDIAGATNYWLKVCRIRVKLSLRQPLTQAAVKAKPQLNYNSQL